MALNDSQEGKGSGSGRPSFAGQPLMPKEYYSIGEVCELVDLKPHVLRYWESQFPELNPSKNRSGNRVFQRKEIKLVMLVKHLLHEEKYTIEGAKQKITQFRKTGRLEGSLATALDSDTVTQVRRELEDALRLLTPSSPA